LMAGIEEDWYNDARLSVAKAMIGISRNNPENATLWLQSLAFETYQSKNKYVEFLGPLHSGNIDHNSVACLKTYEPENWPHYLEQAIITEQFYFALLWEKRYSEALDFALEVLHKLRNIDIHSSKWNERAADAAFYDERYVTAITYYQAAMKLDKSSYTNPLKLADVYHLLGNSQLERQFREQIYGKLEVLAD
jgi:tetratricopeptide (TPR) repeat protein